MKYKYTLTFLIVCILILSGFAAWFFKNFSQVETIPKIEAIDITERKVQEPFVRPERWDREIPETITNKIEIASDGTFTNSKYGFKIKLPKDSFGEESEGGTNNSYYLRVDNYTEEDIIDMYKLPEGKFSLEGYIQALDGNILADCTAEDASKAENIDLGQGIMGTLYWPTAFGGDGPSNGVVLCAIKDGYKYDFVIRESTVFYDDQILRTFKFVK